jgi:hypothetical protein
MILKNKIRLVAVGVVSLAALSLVAGSASAVSQTNGSAAWVSFFDGNSALTTNSTQFAWDSEVYAAASSTDAAAPFVCPATSTNAFVFLSAPGDELVPASWKGSASVAATTVLQAAVMPDALQGSGVGTAKAAGGSYSLGVACTKANGVTAVAGGAFYRSITVTAGGAWVTTGSEVLDGFRFGTQPASQTVATGANATFTATTTGTPAELSIKWQKAESTALTTWADVVNGSGFSGATTGTLVVNAVTDADNGDLYRAVATNSGGTVTSSSATLTVSSTTGSVGMSATTVGAVEGSLSLSVPAGSSVTFGNASLVAGKSTSVGWLPNITVNDDRFNSRQGWNLAANVSDFTFSANSISKVQLGVAPVKVSATALATQVGATQTAGVAVYPLALASGDAGAQVGQTVVSGQLTFVAPQEKAVGTYTSTMTLTLTSK